MTTVHSYALHETEEKKDDGHGVDNVESRRGLLKRLIDHYSSTPITEFPSATTRDELPLSRRGCLTASERNFLEQLVRDGDLATLESASVRLLDDLFPPDDVDTPPTVNENANEEKGKPLSAVTRNSALQQKLFHWHQTQQVAPSQVLRQISLIHRNSIVEDADAGEEQTTVDEASADSSSVRLAEVGSFRSSCPDMSSESSAHLDISSWIDGGVGFEVTENDGVLTHGTPETKAAFKILGTTADDASCHPHVMSPPLMESLLAFLPETLTDYNFYLKYSLARDGASLWTLLRKSRASTNSFLVVETTKGHVFGAFTGQPWRVSQGWWGTKDTFLFKLRHSRLEHPSSAWLQLKNESEIEVYPYRSGNGALQHCSQSGLMLGQGELLPKKELGEHFGYALFLDPSLRKGTTSTSETFANPCLVSPELRGASFEVSNIEVWTLTPHETVKEAEQEELTALFLEGVQTNLSVMSIIVGGPI